MCLQLVYEFVECGDNTQVTARAFDELYIPRLESACRTGFMTERSEGKPQLLVETGGTWVRATVGSGAADTRAQLFVGDGPPSQSSPRFPVFERLSSGPDAGPS